MDRDALHPNNRTWRSSPPTWFLLCLISLFPVLDSPGWAFTLLTPQNGEQYTSGARIPVRVDIGEVGGITAVQYFWYGEQEDMLEELVEKKRALTATAASNPPFGGMIRIPRQAIGNYRLLAVAVQGGAQQEKESWAIFDEVIIHIKPKAPLREIDFQTMKPLRFGRAGTARVYEQVDFLGKIFPLPVIGRFADGVTRPIRMHATGTVYVSSDESVVTVHKDGLLRLVGNGHAVITVKNGDIQASLDVYVEVNDQPNEPPVPDPGPNQVVYAGDRVVLNALGSYDPEGSSLTYHWSQVRGSKIPLLDPFSPKASFLAPYVVDERLFRFKLRVTDVQGADSFPTFVDVIVQP
ncbi:MAG: hypothetical protein D6704_07870 [Nitrospirae bacterium]|nr:MAG: hypothetical protein D6704_07870 [Nitrospirota bacterium]